MSKLFEYQITIAYTNYCGERMSLGQDTYTCYDENVELAVEGLKEYLDYDSMEVVKVECLGELQDE